MTMVSLGCCSCGLTIGALILFGAIFILFLFLKMSHRKPAIVRTEQEKSFPTSDGSRIRFPFYGSHDDNALDSGVNQNEPVTLSVVVPAYMEQDRLPVMLEETMEYLELRCNKNPAFTYEVIIVDDGSRDATSTVAMEYSSKFGHQKVRLLKLSYNRGKGGAVQLGVLSSRGKHVLFADADGATKFEDIEKLESSISSTPDTSMAIGSRAHLAEEAVANRSPFRTFLMYGFHFIVWFFTVRSVKDTQCGFKLIPRNLAMILFSHLHVQRWAFDVELLMVAEKLNIPIKEVAVRWTEIDGSKIVPVFSWLQMGRDVITISLMYLLGRWEYPVAKVSSPIKGRTKQS